MPEQHDSKPPKRLAILVTADPCRTGKAAEAVRIAAGVSVWKRVHVTLILSGRTAQIFSGSQESELVDEEHYSHYLPVLLEEHNATVITTAGPPQHRAVAEYLQPAQTLAEDDLAPILQSQDAVITFTDAD